LDVDEVHSLRDDGNKYELVRGDLFITPPPSDGHETILARLSRILDPFVAEHRLGMLYHPRAVLRFDGSEVEPDLMGRRPNPAGHWETAPTPILVVEVLSDSTRRRDRVQKRKFYLDAGVPEYWIVDPDHLTLRVVRPAVADNLVTTQLTWSPSGATQPLVLALADVFSDARSRE
jgi:Uma2 family endonuclease